MLNGRPFKTQANDLIGAKPGQGKPAVRSGTNDCRLAWEGSVPGFDVAVINAAYPAVRETPLADSFQMRCQVRFQVAFDPLDANGSAGDGLAFGVKNPTVHRPLCHEPQRHFVFVYCSPVRAMLVRKGEPLCRVGLLRFCLLICPRHDKSESAVLAACTQEANRLISRAGTTKVEFRPSNRLAFGIQ